MRPFRFVRARDVPDAIALMGSEPGARYLAGGTNLVDLMREGIEAPPLLIDVSELCHKIVPTAEGGLLIGAGVKNTALAAERRVREQFPLITRAIMAGASGQIRNMASVAGNLLQRTRCEYFYDGAGRCNKRRPGAGCDALDGFNRGHAILGASLSCVATHPSDLCVALAALEARVHIAGAKGSRVVPLVELHCLPGDKPWLETRLLPGELITGVELPPNRFARNSTYRKVRDRASYAFALVSIAAAVELDSDRRVLDVRLALGGVAHRPWRALVAENLLRGQQPGHVVFHEAAAAELDAAQPLAHNGFKVELARRLIVNSLLTLTQPGERVSSERNNSGNQPQGWRARGWGTIGEPVSRRDGPLKVSGQARFAAEVQLPGLVYAALVPSRIAKGRIASLAIGAAEAAPDVVAVMTHRNCPRMNPPLTLREGGAAGAEDPVMQDDRVRWNGETVAVVIARTQEAADAAASLIKVDYAVEPAKLSFEALKAAARRPPTLLGEPTLVEIGGDAEAALSEARVVVDATYRTPRHNHNAIEPHALTAIWTAPDWLVVHDMTQGLHGSAATFAGAFDLPIENVEVHSPYVGGGFGGKMQWSHHLLCAAAAKLTGLPVRLALTRKGVFQLIGGRAMSEQRVALGANSDGTLRVLIHEGTTAVVANPHFAEHFTFSARHMYAAPTLKVDQRIVELDILANHAMRGPGESIGSFALESAMDELADKLEIDPLELRRRNEPTVDPTNGRPFSGRHLLDAYELGAQRFGWESRNPVPGSRREGEWLIGQGMGTAFYPYHRFATSALLRLEASGEAIVRTAAHEMGMGTLTVQAQYAAAVLGLPLDKVRVEGGNSHLPFCFVAAGSMQSGNIAAAVAAAQAELVVELLRLAGNDSPLSGASADELECREGGLYRRGDGRGESYGAILQRAKKDYLEVIASSAPAAETREFSMVSTGVHFCEVRVSEITGEIRVSRWVGAFDTGNILNAKTAASQFRGGIIMGIGAALMEETLMDERTGRFVNPSFASNHVPVHADVPSLEVLWTDLPDPYSPLGLRGVGEIGITGVAGAIANAVYNATGKRMRDLPLTPDKVLAAFAM